MATTPFPSLSHLTQAAQERLLAFNWKQEPSTAVFLNEEHILEAAGDWEMAWELLGDMVVELENSLPLIQDIAFAGGNCDASLPIDYPTSITAVTPTQFSELARAAHGLKGAALNLGLEQLSSTAAAIEVVGRALADRGTQPWIGVDQGTFLATLLFLVSFRNSPFYLPCAHQRPSYFFSLSLSRALLLPPHYLRPRPRP